MLDLKLATDTWINLPHNLDDATQQYFFYTTINLRYNGIGCAADSDIVGRS